MIFDGQPGKVEGAGPRDGDGADGPRDGDGADGGDGGDGADGADGAGGGDSADGGGGCDGDGLSSSSSFRRPKNVSSTK